MASMIVGADFEPDMALNQGVSLVLRQWRLLVNVSVAVTCMCSRLIYRAHVSTLIKPAQLSSGRTRKGYIH